MYPRALVLVGLVATALPAQQAPDLLLAPSSWAVTAIPAEVAVTAVGDRLDFLSNCNHANSPVTVTTQVQVSQPGTYLLWLDAVWADAPTSYQPWTWTIPGVGSGAWTQNDLSGSRDVAQWSITLPAGPHAVVLTATSHGCGGLGRFWGAELRKVDGPILLPDLCYVDPFQVGATAYASFTIGGASPLAQPNYLVFTSSSTLITPFAWPFGDQWLASPLYLGTLGQASFTPPWGPAAQTLHGLFVRPVAAPQWWQVAEYDATNPIATLRLGSPTRTSSLH